VLRRIHRTIDANLNRVSEGLRVLEDIARFIIEDKDSSREIKSRRHFFSKLARSENLTLIESRNAESDIGAERDLTDQHKDLVSVIHANSKRVQEGIRVLEELVKLPELGKLCSFSELRKQRYAIYTLEQSLINGLKSKTGHYPRLGAISDEKTGKHPKKTG
jgi:thiamine-phosphate pyrophosphorylase